MVWQFWLLLSILSEVFGRLFQRSLLEKDKSDPIAYAILFQVTTGLLLFSLAFIKGFSIPSLSPILINLLLMPFLYGFANIFIFKSLKTVEASIFTVLFSSRTLWIVLLALILLNEAFSPQQFLGAGLILTGVILVSFKKKHLTLSKGELYALLAAIFFSAAIINDSYIVKSFDVVSYLSIAFTLPGLFIWIIYPRSTPQIRKIIKSNVIFKLSLLSLVYGVSAVSYLTAYQIGSNAAQMATLFQTSSILTVFAGIVFLRERTRLFLKLIAGIISFIGVILVV